MQAFFMDYTRAQYVLVGAIDFKCGRDQRLNMLRKHGGAYKFSITMEERER
jgi:FAD synthase